MAFWDGALSFAKKPISARRLKMTDLPETAPETPHDDGAPPARRPAPPVQKIALSRTRNHEPVVTAPSHHPDVHRIDTAVNELGAATAALDAIELQLIKAKAEIHRVQASGADLDFDEIDRVIDALAAHINETLRNLRPEAANIVADTKLEIAFSAPGAGSEKDFRLELYLISVESLAVLRHATDGTPQAYISFIDDLINVVNANINILTSLLVTLCASRDYTVEVTKLARSVGIAQPGVVGTQAPLTSAAEADRLAVETAPRLEDLSGTADPSQQHDAGNEANDAGAQPLRLADAGDAVAHQRPVCSATEEEEKTLLSYKGAVGHDAVGLGRAGADSAAPVSRALAPAAPAERGVEAAPVNGTGAEIISLLQRQKDR